MLAERKVSRRDDFVVLECATGAPGEMPKLAAAVRPNVAIVTLVALEHYSAFRSKEAVAREKSALVKALPPDGLALLNNDDPHVASMAELTDARVVTFGKAGACYSWDELISAEPGNLTFALRHRDRKIILRTRLSGAHNRLAVSAAAACALELGIPESSVIECVASFEPILGRLSIHKCDRGPTFILDTAKAPYHSLPLSLSVLKDFVAPRKRFVLGHISDFAGNPKAKYRDTYRAAHAVADQVLLVGMAAKNFKASRDEIEAGKFASLATVEELSKYIKSSAIAGEVILVKSSANLHLERLLLDWNAEVRCWPNACGKPGVDCLQCGLYRLPFSQHGGRVTKPKFWSPWREGSRRDAAGV